MRAVIESNTEKKQEDTISQIDIDSLLKEFEDKTK